MEKIFEPQHGEITIHENSIYIYIKKKSEIQP